VKFILPGTINPHNRSYDAEANGMIRVNNWSEAIAVVDRLAGK
jgi:hypothetical protein